MSRYVILVAGGSGSRMQGNLPKQFLLLNGEPILAHTLRKFSIPGLHLIVVMHTDFLTYWEDQCSVLFNLPAHRLVAGGKTRAASVANGLALVPENGIVAIHDAVRPLCSTSLINNLFEVCEAMGSAVPVVPCSDSLRMVTPTGSQTVLRENYRYVQTPQVFLSSALKNAYATLAIESFTDDASLFEAAGNKVNLTEGETTNIKITYASDMLIAEAILASA